MVATLCHRVTPVRLMRDSRREPRPVLYRTHAPHSARRLDQPALSPPQRLRSKARTNPVWWGPRSSMRTPPGRDQGAAALAGMRRKARRTRPRTARAGEGSGSEYTSASARSRGKAEVHDTLRQGDTGAHGCGHENPFGLCAADARSGTQLYRKAHPVSKPCRTRPPPCERALTPGAPCGPALVSARSDTDRADPEGESP